MAHILAIDDDEFFRKTLQIMLEEDGHTVVLAEDGAVGVKMIDRESFDLVIMDIFMPEKEGFEALADIKSKIASMKVLMISGGGTGAKEDLYLSQAKMLGADDTLAKPFFISDLSEKVNQLLKSG